jgi:ABC-type nickel/cobalt efflux system permease component RcnA
MPDWLIAWLGQMQGGIVRTLATELRAGGIGTIGFAFALGALHALTPGHGKAALAAYFLGREARITAGLQIALTAALLHVLSGLALFLVLRFVVGQVPSMLGRNSPTFTVVGYGLIIVAGAIMVAQSLRAPHSHGDGAHALTAGIGLLPCPLTISVLGFAWTQTSSAMVLLVLISLALGIALTIGLVALAAIIGRRTMGIALAGYLPGLERWSRIVQAAAGILIMGLGVATLMSLWR